MVDGRYRAAIVGTGAIATAHAGALRANSDRVRLAAVVDVDAEQARAFAETWQVDTVAPTVTALLAEGGIDLVHLCTPPVWHAPLALECLRAGVHVLVEKPPTLSLAELDTLIEASAASGAHLATVFQHRFGAGAVRLRAMAAAGELGRPMLATCDTLWYRDDDYYRVPWRGRWDTEGGGPTMGHGIHQFDLLLSVLGPWESVTAVAARRARPIETEDVSMALVTFASGAVATVVNSVLSPRQVSALRFDYEQATVELSHLYGYSDDDWTVHPAPGHEDVATRWSWAPSREESGHAGQLTAVLDALDAGRPLPVTAADTRQTMEFVAALYASAFTGSTVHSGQIGPDSPFAASMHGAGAPWTAVAA
ncbi:Gfo/Idh/MocA family oxidoreductase [Dactylosporangium aurantiacum]|uniref:Gfo/Idh/MocA family oxidoreductase n=1 Tax=Dactylosporangium aurantiacum TaxID=35754 RepID=A0A9Q9IN81_9ACTN|nr:Gfo/Idh/MocA family oxidoreductase [Dactylosporangium aurantiacum]MDG6107644.1 Gfo/Idh/MocA family oxidoreductase [Dactylosporangium aurantiacum]UWZ58761.1 Gfo/Idh/MocA family oxidoreductase [Dactylosporangium aurantiacum]